MHDGGQGCKLSWDRNLELRILLLKSVVQCIVVSIHYYAKLHLLIGIKSYMYHHPVDQG